MAWMGITTAGWMAMALLGMPAAQASAPAGPVATATPPPLAVEENDIAVLSDDVAHRLFYSDPYYGTSLNVVDAGRDALPVLGMVDIPLNGSFTLNRDASLALVVETYWAHGTRGARTDLLTIYDARKLTVVKEVELPGRFMAEAKTGMVSLSSDEKLAYVYDMIPNSQVHVVDIAAGKVINTLDISGCWLAMAYGPRGFASICGDGTISTVQVPASGEGKPISSAKFFDADTDPLFENGMIDRDTGEGWFVSFTGKIYPVKLGTGAAAVGKPWSITAAAGLPVATTGVQDLAWRPGGNQILGLHRQRRQLFVLMHAGNHWTHKAEGNEVWVLDADKHTLLRRIPLASGAKAIAVTQDAAPLLITSGGRTSTLGVYDATTGKLLRQRVMAGHFEGVAGL